MTFPLLPVTSWTQNTLPRTCTIIMIIIIIIIIVLIIITIIVVIVIAVVIENTDIVVNQMG